MRSLSLNLCREFFGAARRTILYPPRWTSLPGGRKAEVIKLSDAYRRPGDRREGTPSVAAAGVRTTPRAEP